MNKRTLRLGAKLAGMRSAIHAQGDRQRRIESQLADNILTPAAITKISPHFSRNFLPNDDSVAQKTLVSMWRAENKKVLRQNDFIESGFRAFSQNDEDGIILRIFAQIGTVNRCVVEIGSNCYESDVGIPENMSTNLIVNHGWHGIVIEMDQMECGHLQYFFARSYATRHYHGASHLGGSYYSPLIVQREITPENINETLLAVRCGKEPDLMVVDIDSGDYGVVDRLDVVKPRVLVVEFERRFRDRFSVVQPKSSNCSSRWQQSGTASLLAWDKLLQQRGYFLCAICSSGFNAFFVRRDVAVDKVEPITPGDAFNNHPVFSHVDDSYWKIPDETWQEV